MPLDTSIALSLKPLQLNDPLETQVRRQQVQANALAMRSAESQNALAQKAALDKQVMGKLYAESYDSNTGSVDYTKLAKRAAQLGMGNEIPAIQTAGQEFKAKQQATTKDFNANVSSSMDNARMRLEGVRTPEQFMQWHEQNHNDPTLKEYFDRIGVTPEQSRAQIAAVANDPAAFADLLQKAQLGLAKAQTAVNEQANRGVTMRGQDIGAATAKAGQQVTMRGQDIGAATARRSQDLQASAIGHVIKNPDGSSSLVSNQGKVVSTLTPAAGPKANDGRKMLGDTLDEIYGYYNTLKSQGAAASSQSGTLLGNIGAGLRGSLPGEAVESLMGTKAQTARDSIRMARPMIIASLKDALHLSAQQLNSNKELQLWLSAATDPTKSYEANIAALNNLARVANTGKIYTAPAPTAQAGTARGGVDTSNPLLK